MRHFFLGLLCAAILVSIAACGGGSSIPGVQTPGISDNQGESTLVSSDGFELSIHDSSFQHGGEAQFSLDVIDDGSGRTVNIITDAIDLRSVHLRLDYDAGSVHPVSAELSAWPGLAGDEQISLAVTDEPGSVHLGSTIIHPHLLSGVDGQFSVASIRFDNGAFPAGHAASAAPAGTESRIPDLLVDQGAGSVSFSYVNNGDYDQNSTVGIADITPLGVNFGEASGGGSFPFNDALSVVDGDDNGAITLADITPIAVNFGSSVESWTIYGGPAADYPQDAAGGNGSGSALASIGFADDSGLNPSQSRLRYEMTVPGLAGNASESFWLRPVSSGNEGISSNMAGSAGPDSTAPFWVGGAEHTGVMSLVPGDGSMRVNWYEADDSQNWPGSYTVFWSEGESIDFETAQTMQVSGLAKDHEDAGSEQSALVDGLSNGMMYAFAVRASDGAVPANWEDNSLVLTGMPLASQALPSSITDDVVLDGPWYVGAGETVDFSNSASLTVNGDLTVEGTIQAGDSDINLIVNGDLTISGQVVQQLPDDPDVPSDDAKSVNIVIGGNADFSGEPFDVNGNLQIVSAEDDLLSPEEATEDIDNGDFEEFPYTFMPLQEDKEGSSAGVFRSASAKTVYYGPRWTWHMRGNWGTVPVQPRHVKRVVLRVYQRRGQIKGTDWNITGPSGRDGKDVAKCNTADGEDGEDNRWRMRMHASRAIVLDNCTITMGSGGDGGEGKAIGCCPEAVANGGKGGKSNNKYRITAGRLIRIKNNFTMNPGWGGNGGDAIAEGGDGADGCPAEDGCDAFAYGGAGGDMPLWGMRVRGNVFGGANIILGKAFGGDGGWAWAYGGDGGDDTCCMLAGHGGSATALAGNGGSAKYISGSGFTGSGGGAESGHGGDAEAEGGDGGNGSSCFKAKAGDGGDGGFAEATGGNAGVALGEATQGDDGDADATGGDGGDGGDGFPVGIGGAGGLAVALGATSNAVDGSDGQDGEEWPFGGWWIWCIDFMSFLPDPGMFPAPGDPPVKLPDGSSGSVDLLDTDTMEVIGSVPFVVHDTSDDFTSGVWLSMNNDIPSSPRPQLQIINNGEMSDQVSIDIQLSQLELGSTLPVTVTGASFDISQSGIFGESEIPGFVNFFEPDPFLPLGGMAFPEVPYVSGESSHFEITPDPALPEGMPVFDMSINVAPLCFIDVFTIYIIDP